MPKVSVDKPIKYVIKLTYQSVPVCAHANNIR